MMSGRGYGIEVDMWSVGVILYILYVRSVCCGEWKLGRDVSSRLLLFPCQAVWTASLWRFRRRSHANANQRGSCGVPGCPLARHFCGWCVVAGAVVPFLCVVVLTRQVVRPCFVGGHVTARSLVASLLTVDPSARITAAQVLRHPWLQARPSNTGRTTSTQAPEYVLPRRILPVCGLSHVPGHGALAALLRLC